MDAQAVPLQQLDLIGYADVLPGGHGPVVVPPVFCSRTPPERCYVPPFEIAGNFLVGPQVLSHDEVSGLASDGKLTLPAGFRPPAQPDHRLWVDGDGTLRYEPALAVNRQLQACFLRQLTDAEAALRAGDLESAETAAGLALVAQERAVETIALLAVCHALRGEGAEVAFLKESAEAAGHPSASFTQCVESYFESISPSAWQDFLPRLKAIRQACSGTDIRVWVSFAFSEHDYQCLRPLLHDFRRQGEEHGVRVSCWRIEADLLKSWPLLQVAYDYADALVKHEGVTAILALAAKAMLYEPSEIASSYQHALKRTVEDQEIKELGKLVRKQQSRQLVSVPDL